MGVTFSFRTVDHEHVIDRGTEAVDHALDSGDKTVLEDYIASLPFEPNPELSATYERRVAKLVEMNAPDVIVQSEKKMLSYADGEAYARDALAKLKLDELRELLGTWGWMQNSFRLGKCWFELDWFLQPKEGVPEYPLYPLRPKPGDSEQSDLDRILYGGTPSPLDSSGAPILRSCGAKDNEGFGYNPPDSVAHLVSVLSEINEDSWSDLVPKRIELHRRAETRDADVLSEFVANELDYARQAFAVLKAAYTSALDRGFGIASEFCS